MHSQGPDPGGRKRAAPPACVLGHPLCTPSHHAMRGLKQPGRGPRGEEGRFPALRPSSQPTAMDCAILVPQTFGTWSRHAFPAKLSPRCRFVSEVNDHCGFKSFSFGVVLMQQHLTRTPTLWPRTDASLLQTSESSAVKGGGFKAFQRTFQLSQCIL